MMQLQIGGAHEWKTRVRYGLRRGEVPVVVEQWAVAHWPFFRVLLVPSFLASPQPRPFALSRSSFISIVLEYAQIVRELEGILPISMGIGDWSQS